MRKLFAIYHRHFTFDINKPKSQLFGYISQQKEKKRSLYDKLIGIPDSFNQVSVTGEDTIEISIHPKTLNPFRGNGVIRIIFASNSNTIGTELRAEIIPYYNSNIIGFYIILFFLVFFSIISLLGNTNRYMVFALGLLWVVFMLILHLTMIWSISQLKENLDVLINELKRKDSHK
jgi:hypothetical protein